VRKGVIEVKGGGRYRLMGQHEGANFLTTPTS
jgi:hypothetical protein